MQIILNQLKYGQKTYFIYHWLEKETGATDADPIVKRIGVI